MFTQCPDCRKVYSLGSDLNHDDKTRLYCTVCEKEFNVIDLLSENPLGLLAEAKTKYIAKAENKPKARTKKKRKTRPQLPGVQTPEETTPLPQVAAEQAFVPAQEPAEVAIDSAQPDQLPWELSSRPLNINWQLGVVLSLLVLFGQLIVYSMDDFSQSVLHRPFLEKAAGLFNFSIADYRNLNEFEVMHGSFTASPDKTISFKAVISNQAPFRQKLPALKLSLLDYEGRLFAQRYFQPSEYLTEQAASDYIGSDESKEIQLKIKSPSTPVGGYNFDLTY